MIYNMFLDYIWRIKSINLRRLYTYNSLSCIQNLHLYMDIFAYLSLSLLHVFIVLSYHSLSFFFFFFSDKKVEIVFKWVDVCLIDICCMLDSHSFIFTMIWIKFVVILVFVTHWFTLLFYWLVHASHRYVWIIHSWMRFLSSYAC